jgi:hypothetical protein
MSNDKSDRGGRPVLTTLREMLGLEGEAFIGAMKEAVWVPGGVDQLADMIIRSLSVEDQYRLTRELPDVPEVMALIGRLLLALNDHPRRKDLGAEVIARAQQLGQQAINYLSPYSWYPPVDKIKSIRVSPTRLESSTITLRMQWGDEYEGIEAVWVIRFAAGELGEVYFSTDEADAEGLDELPWMTLDMDQALSLITAAGMVQSAVNSRFPFDGMAGVGLWMVLAGGREVRPWIDGSFELEAHPLGPQEVALAEVNALSAGDYLAAYDLCHADWRNEDVLEYIAERIKERPATGELWRLDAGPVEQKGGAPSVTLRAWYRVDEGLVDRAYEVDLLADEAGRWRIARMDLIQEGSVDEAERDQYLANNLRYYAQLPVLDMEELAELMPGAPVSQSGGAVHFVSGADVDYRHPYDIAKRQDLTWTVNLNGDITILVSASDEILLRREVQRLQDEDAAGDILGSGTLDLALLDQISEAANEGADRLEHLLAAAVRR